MQRSRMTEQEILWVETYQSYLANFIRTGNPNDWTDNPNSKPSDEIDWPNYLGSTAGSWTQLGLDIFDSYTTNDDERKARCDMLDDINHYMLH